MGTDQAADQPAENWHADPFGRHEQRWWDGSRWSEKVRDDGLAAIDPPGIDAAPHSRGETEPARPIDDAPLPLRPPAAATQVALAIGTVVLIGLVVAIIVLALTG